MNDIFFELSVKSHFALSIFKDFVFELGITAIEENEDSFIIRDSDDLSNVVFALNNYKNALEKELNLQIDLDLKLETKANSDWISKYQKSVKPIEIDDIYIHPSWEKPKKGLINIIVDPALAFGSGHHESTSMCLSLIQKYKNGYKTALDVGCGSGILSISLAKLGLSVDACDTDEQAILSAKENFFKNEVKFDKMWVGSVSASKKEYDLVVANIIADVLIVLKNDLVKSVKNNGILILSGVLEKYLDRIKDSFKELSLIEVKQKNEWLSFVFKKI